MNSAGLTIKKVSNSVFKCVFRALPNFHFDGHIVPHIQDCHLQPVLTLIWLRIYRYRHIRNCSLLMEWCVCADKPLQWLSPECLCYSLFFVCRMMKSSSRAPPQSTRSNRNSVWPLKALETDSAFLSPSPTLRYWFTTYAFYLLCLVSCTESWRLGTSPLQKS